MTVETHSYKVTVFLNNVFTQGGEYQKHVYISASTEEKALIIARDMFKKVDYEYMSASRSSDGQISLWDVDKIKELKE
jgi:hypothetical protein